MKRRLMGWWQDESGVTVVLGALLMFALVVTSYAFIQAYQVPVWNQDVEWQHLNQVYNDMLTMKSNIQEVSQIKAPKSSPIELGVTYPNRMFLFNPGSGVTGSLTSENMTVTVGYTLDVPGNPTFTRTYQSNRIAYQAFGTIDSPRLVYDNGLMVRDFGTSAVSTDEQPILQGNDMFIPVLSGGPVSLSSTSTEQVNLRPMLDSINVARVASANVTLDTDYPDVWGQALAGDNTTDTTINIDYANKKVIISSTAIKQIVFPSANITTEDLYAGLIELRTKYIPQTFSSINVNQNYPSITNVSIVTTGTGNDKQTHSTITATVKNATAPFDIIANLSNLTQDTTQFQVQPDTSSPDSITATSWSVPNTETVTWNVVNPAYSAGQAVIVSFTIQNTQNFQQYFTFVIFTRSGSSSWN